jgi:CheY-specific phosphatase CheX
MQQSLVDTARESAIRTLERAAFLFTDEITEKKIPQIGDDWQQKGVSLDYTGPFQGELRLWMPESLSRMIASNMLGIDEGMDLAKQEEDDALKEILNIILGIYLTDAYGNEPVFHLGIPQILSSEQWVDSVRANSYFWMDVEGEPVLMSVHGGE